MFEYKDSVSIAVAFILALVAWWLDMLAVRIGLALAATAFLVWPFLHKRFAVTLPMTLVGVAALAMLGGIGWQIAWYGFRWTESTALPSPANEQASSAAIAKLAALGWTVKPSQGTIVFEVNGAPLPPMDQSAPYFAQINKPFSLHLQQVKSLDGLHHIADILNCTKMDIAAGDFTDISELRGFSHLTALTISQVPLNLNGTVDTSPLATLRNLRTLSLGMSKVRDSSFLRELTSLQKLYLAQTFVADISGIISIYCKSTVCVMAQEKMHDVKRWNTPLERRNGNSENCGLNFNRTRSCCTDISGIRKENCLHFRNKIGNLDGDISPDSHALSDNGVYRKKFALSIGSLFVRDSSHSPINTPGRVNFTDDGRTFDLRSANGPYLLAVCPKHQECWFSDGYRRSSFCISHSRKKCEHDKHVLPH